MAIPMSPNLRAKVLPQTGQRQQYATKRLTAATANATAANTVAGQGIAAAAALIMFLPNLVIFIILQSQVMSTMSHSGLK